MTLDGVGEDTSGEDWLAVGEGVAESGLQEDLVMGDDVATESEGPLQHWFSHAVCGCQREREREGGRVREREREGGREGTSLVCSSLALGPSPAGNARVVHRSSSTTRN